MNPAKLRDAERRLVGLSHAELNQEALAALQAADLPIETIEPNTGWQRHPKHSAVWYAADAGTGSSGLPWLMVTAGNAKTTGDVSTPTVVYKSWKQEGRTVSPDDAAAIKQQIEAATAKRMEQQRKDRAVAAEQAQATWASASTATNGHEYLQAKQVQAYGIKRLTQSLLIPVADTQGTLHGLQQITPDGSKRFNSGAAVSGHFHLLGDIRQLLYLCEGYATAATIHEATRQAVACCFNAGNLKPVAQQLREAHPQARLVICADDDQWTESNPGRTKATEAAQATGAALVVPTFKDISSKPTDFNDLQQLEGMDTVK